jgi:hypothetical protein
MALAGFLAICSACWSEANVVLRHAASRRAPPEADTGWRMARRLLPQPTWSLRAGALPGAFLFRAVAPHLTELSLVQPLLRTALGTGVGAADDDHQNNDRRAYDPRSVGHVLAPARLRTDRSIRTAKISTSQAPTTDGPWTPAEKGGYR